MLSVPYTAMVIEESKGNKRVTNKMVLNAL